MRPSLGVVLLVSACALVAPALPSVSLAAPAADKAPRAAGPQKPPPAPAKEQAPPAPAKEQVPAAPEPPGPIPVPEIVKQAEEVANLLRGLAALAAPKPEIEAIQARLTELVARLDLELSATITTLNEAPPGTIVDRLAQSWQASRGELSGWQDVVTRRATQLDRELDRLASLQATWVKTRTDARASREPTPVVQRIEAVLADIEAARSELQAQRAATLLLQDQVAREIARCEDILARIARHREEALAFIFVRSAPAIWSLEPGLMDLADLSARLQEDLDSSTDLLRRYVENHRGRLFLNVLLFVGLIFMTLAGRRRARDLAAAGDGALRAATASLFDRPYSAAALAGLVSTLLMNPGRPRVAADLIGVLMLPPLLRIVRPLVTAAVAPAVYGLAVLVLLDRARAELTVSPAFDQVVLLVEMLAAIGGLAWLLASGRLDRAAAGETASEGVRGRHVAAGICLVLCLVAFSATAWGTLRLARTVGSSVLVGAILAMAFHATIHVADSLLAFAFRVRPLRLLAMVRNHRDLLERRAHRWLGWIAIGGWTAIMVRYAGLQDPVLAFGAAVLSAELRRGAIGISLGDVLAFLLTVWLAFMASAFLRFLLEEDVFPHLRLARGVPYVISSLLHYVILFLGFLLAIAALGLDLNKVTILAGAFGVGLGFGLQGMVNNFVSGLIVLLERPISVGDTIQLGDVSGEVRRIGIRSTTVQTPEGAEVIVPNGSLVAEKVTNWTLSSHVRRLNVVAGVAYGTPPGEVLELLRAVAAAHPQVLAHPAPTALFLGFGESAMNFALYAWTAHFDRWAEIRSDLNVAVYAALQKAGIEIPFPQHEVHLRQK